MERFNGVILDMDGVLVDTEPLHGKAWGRVMRDRGVTDLAPDWFLVWVGLPDRLTAEGLRESHNLDATVDQLLDHKRAVYGQLVSSEMRLFPGVAEGIDRLNGLSLACVTSSVRGDALHTLTTAGLLNRFPVLITADDVSECKPAPEPFLKAVGLMGLDAEACVVVEDSLAGVQGGRAAGCTVLGVASTHPAHVLEEAHQVFPDTASALAWIDEERITREP